MNITLIRHANDITDASRTIELVATREFLTNKWTFKSIINRACM